MVFSLFMGFALLGIVVLLWGPIIRERIVNPKPRRQARSRRIDLGSANSPVGPPAMQDFVDKGVERKAKSPWVQKPEEPAEMPIGQVPPHKRRGS